MGCFQCICKRQGLQSLIRAKIMLKKQQIDALKKGRHALLEPKVVPMQVFLTCTDK